MTKDLPKVIDLVMLDLSTNQTSDQKPARCFFSRNPVKVEKRLRKVQLANGFEAALSLPGVTEHHLQIAINLLNYMTIAGRVEGTTQLTTIGRELELFIRYYLEVYLTYQQTASLRDILQIKTKNPDLIVVDVGCALYLLASRVSDEFADVIAKKLDTRDKGWHLRLAAMWYKNPERHVSINPAGALRNTVNQATLDVLACELRRVPELKRESALIVLTLSIMTNQGKLILPNILKSLVVSSGLTLNEPLDTRHDWLRQGLSAAGTIGRYLEVVNSWDNHPGSLSAQWTETLLRPQIHRSAALAPEGPSL